MEQPANEKTSATNKTKKTANDRSVSRSRKAQVADVEADKAKKQPLPDKLENEAGKAKVGPASRSKRGGAVKVVAGAGASRRSQSAGASLKTKASGKDKDAAIYAEGAIVCFVNG